MKTLNAYLRDRFGCKVYKISLNGGFTCPNRDGKIDTRGCIFCSAGGSGEFASDPKDSVTKQIEDAKKRVAKKTKDGKYIAYFQAYTGTYAPVERLRALYTEALNHSDVVALSIATRPDCLNPEVLQLLDEMNKTKPVWVELGLQSIHEKTAAYIDILKECVKLIPEDVVIHRFTGDGDKKLLLAPLWSANKKHVLNRINREILV